MKLDSWQNRYLFQIENHGKKKKKIIMPTLEHLA